MWSIVTQANTAPQDPSRHLQLSLGEKESPFSESLSRGRRGQLTSAWMPYLLSSTSCAEPSGLGALAKESSIQEVVQGVASGEGLSWELGASGGWHCSKTWLCFCCPPPPVHMAPQCSLTFSIDAPGETQIQGPVLRAGREQGCPGCLVTQGGFPGRERPAQPIHCTLPRAGARALSRAPSVPELEGWNSDPACLVCLDPRSRPT